MKRNNIIAFIMAIVMIMATATVSYAYSDFCSFTETEEHDFTFSTSMKVAHPHKGFYECGCGERVYKDKIFSDECTACRFELCDKGIHCYTANIQYTDNGYSGYGECYCGKKAEFSYDKTWLSEEPYQGFITFFDKYYTIKHPHQQYNMSEQRYYSEKTIHDGSCGVCKLADEYYDQVRDYNINGAVYDYDFYEETSYYDDSDEYADEAYEPYDEYYEEEYDYEYDSSEDDEFYDWLELVKELFGNG